MKKLKAYSVQGYEKGTVVFAQYAIVARREGAQSLDLEFDEIESCRRMPEVDHLAEQGFVTMRQLVEEHDWCAFCGWCESRIYNDEPERVWVGHDRAFCSAEHRDKLIEHFPELKEEL